MRTEMRAAALLLPLLASCAGGDGEWGGTVTDSAGVTVVHNRATDGRIARGGNDAFRIEILARDGTVERVITRPFERAPVTENDRNALRDTLRDDLDVPHVVRVRVDG